MYTTLKIHHAIRATSTSVFSFLRRLFFERENAKFSNFWSRSCRVRYTKKKITLYSVIKNILFCWYCSFASSCNIKSETWTDIRSLIKYHKGFGKYLKTTQICLQISFYFIMLCLQLSLFNEVVAKRFFKVVPIGQTQIVLYLLKDMIAGEGLMKEIVMICI